MMGIVIREGFSAEPGPDLLALAIEAEEPAKQIGRSDVGAVDRRHRVHGMKPGA